MLWAGRMGPQEMHYRLLAEFRTNVRNGAAVLYQDFT